MKICDLCSKETEVLIELQSIVQCFGVQEVCRDCEKELNEYRTKIHSILEAINLKAKESFWLRLMSKLKLRKSNNA